MPSHEGTGRKKKREARPPRSVGNYEQVPRRARVGKEKKKKTAPMLGRTEGREKGKEGGEKLKTFPSVGEKERPS